MLKIGDRVKVCIPTSEQTAGNNVRQYNGQVRSIRSRGYIPKGGYYFHLVGCQSDYGIPYCFCEDWLQLVIESEDRT